MNTRTRGKVIAQVAGASLIAASTVGAAALAVETYQDINHQQTQSAAVTAPITQGNDTSSATTGNGTATGTNGTTDTDTSATEATATDTNGTSTGTTTDTEPSTTYVQAPHVGARSHGSSSGS